MSYQLLIIRPEKYDPPLFLHNYLYNIILLPLYETLHYDTQYSCCIYHTCSRCSTNTQYTDVLLYVFNIQVMNTYEQFLSANKAIVKKYVGLCCPSVP